MRPLSQVLVGLLLAAAAQGRAMEPGTAAAWGGGAVGVLLSECFPLSPGAGGAWCSPWATQPHSSDFGAGLVGAGGTGPAGARHWGGSVSITGQGGMEAGRSRVAPDRLSLRYGGSACTGDACGRAGWCGCRGLWQLCVAPWRAQMP